MKAKVKFTIEIPKVGDYTARELEDWLRFEFRDNGDLSSRNPFNNYTPYPKDEK